MGDLPQLALLDDLRGFLEVRPRPLLRAELDDAVGALVGAESFDSALDSVRERLLEIDVLAGGHGVDQHLAMPVVRRRDVDDIHVLAIENSTVVLIALDLHVLLQIGQLLGPLLQPGRVGVAVGHVLDVGIAPDELGCHRPSAAARADQATRTLSFAPRGPCARRGVRSRPRPPPTRRDRRTSGGSACSRLLMRFLQARERRSAGTCAPESRGTAASERKPNLRLDRTHRLGPGDRAEAGVARRQTARIDLPVGRYCALRTV